MVHGTDLYLHYLRRDETGKYIPRDHDVRIKSDQFITVIEVIVDTIIANLKTLTSDQKQQRLYRCFF